MVVYQVKRGPYCEGQEIIGVLDEDNALVGV